MEKTVTIPVPAEDVEYVDSIRVYNVKVPISELVAYLPKKWGKVRKNLEKQIKKYPNLAIDCIDAAYLYGLEKNKELKSGEEIR